MESVPSGSVYFVQSEHGGPVKIGWAADPQTRLRDLQVGNPEKLILRATIQGTLADEHALHRRFAVERLTGEWFEPTPELEHIAGCKLVKPAGAATSHRPRRKAIRMLVCDTCRIRPATIIDLRPWARWNCDVHLLCDHPDCDTLGYWTTIERYRGNDYPDVGGMRKHITDSKDGGPAIVVAIDQCLLRLDKCELAYIPKDQR